MPGFRTGWNLPPGVTDRMIDEAAGGYDEPPFDDEDEPEEEEPTVPEHLTQATFTKKLRENLVAKYAWASDTEKLDRMMAKITEMFEQKRYLVAIDGEAIPQTWRELGGKGKPTYKALFALPKA